MSVSNGVYRLKNAKSGTYLDASVKSHGKVHGWDSRPDNRNQQWQVEESGGRYTLKNVGNGEYLSVSSTNNGSDVRVSGNPTRWNLDQEGNSYVILADNSQAAVDLDMGRDDNGTDVNVWHNSGAQQQKWRFEQVGGSQSGGYGGHSQSGVHPGGQYSGVLPFAPYFVRNVHTGTALDLSGSKADDGTRVIGYQVTSGENQKWVLESGSQGYRIRNSASGSYLGYSRQEQPHEGLLLTGNSNPVEWDIRQADNGYQVYLAGQSHLVIDLASGDASDGAKICLWSNKNGANQKWRFERA